MSQQALPCTPPPKMIEGGFIFSYGCLVPPKFFPKKKVDFVGDIRIGTHQNVPGEGGGKFGAGGNFFFLLLFVLFCYVL